MSSSPRIILTSGEPAGIGPDLCIAVAQRNWPCELIVAGDATMLEHRARHLGLNSPKNILHEPLAAPAEPGQLNPANARYVLRLLDRAVEGCQRGDFQAMVTAPVQKSVINDAGIPFTGHTEYLAERTGARLPVMMLVASPQTTTPSVRESTAPAADASNAPTKLSARSLRVALATIHLPLSRVSDAITTDGLFAILSILDADLRRLFRIERPRILVCGLNPHAGEGGHLGTEEIDTIIPAVINAQRAGIDAIGPVPADTAFTPRSLEGIDAVLAMYHDQGLPVLKYAGFGHAVNITLGLPIVRTSVDHGTALPLAGAGQADPGSLIAALNLAIQLSAPRRLG